MKIDFFGQKKDTYFDEKLPGIGIFEYKGVLQPHEVVPTLQQYDILIFPTHYDGEGCPGIMIEALSASLPIIASDWKYNNEFVRDGVNGFLCETYNVEQYVAAIKLLLYDNLLKAQISKNAYYMSELYSADNARSLLEKWL